MIFPIQDIARLSVAIMLFAIWSARRVERANLYFAASYTAMTVAALTQNQSTLTPLLRGIEMLAYVSATLLMWSGAQLFRDRRVAPRSVLLAGASALIASIELANLDAMRTTQSLALLLAISTLYTSYHLWRYAHVYRLTAAVTAFSALLFLACDGLFLRAPGVRGLLALSYIALTIAIGQVTVIQFQKRLTRVAHTDALTGLANRAAFAEALHSLLSATGRDPVYVAVMCIDIENFRSVNEAIGYRNGNRILCELAGRLRHAASRVYLLARDEGDRFMLLLSGTSDTTAMRNAEEAASAVLGTLEAPFRIDDVDLAIRVRIGADIAWGPDTDIEVLIQQAGVASGRQRGNQLSGLQFYSAQMNRVALRKLDLDRGLRDALSQGGLTLVYQPIIDVESSKTLMVEALLRWTSPVLGVVEPAEMIPAAEESGLIVELGAWVVEEAARQCAAWRSSGLAVPVSVNVSAHQLRRLAFAAQVLAALKRHEVSPEMFEIELTESVFLGDDPVIMANINALHAAGVRMSLDDFGTGFSNLSYLTRLPLSSIKIDKTFVHQLQVDERSRRLTETICAIGHQLDFALTAEGVETAEQSMMLRSFGVRRMQGFFFARPISGVEIAERLQTVDVIVTAA